MDRRGLAGRNRIVNRRNCVDAGTMLTSPLVLSFCYLVLRQVFQLLTLRFRSDDFKDLEILLLRHELAILRRQSRRPSVTAFDRMFFTAASRLLPRNRWSAILITPATLLRWHLRRFVRGCARWPRTGRHAPRLNG